MTRVDRSATLVVTRPQPDADQLCDAIRARGRHALAYPVLAIEAPADDGPLRRAMADLERYPLVVFVSPNAIRRALAVRTAPWPARSTVGVMGPGSRATLASLGVAAPAVTVVSPAVRQKSDGNDRFDSEALFAALDETIGLARGLDGPVLILRGNGGRAWFADRLRGIGIAVDEVEAYRRVRPAPESAASDALRALFVTQAPVAFVVTSSEGLGHLDALVERSLAGAADPVDTRAWLHGAPMLAPHARIVAQARQAGFTQVIACGAGDSGILAAIE